MRKIGYIVMAMLLASMFVFIGCDNSTESSDTHPMVGTWEMTNMQQSALYTAKDTIQMIGKFPGDTLGGGTKTWSDFSAIGVNATANLREDNTYSLSGAFPNTSDTLGFPLDTLSLTDGGTWEADDPVTEVLLAGNFYVIPPSGQPGPVTVDDPENPTTLSISYSEVELDTVVLPVDTSGNQIPDFFIPNVRVNSATQTTLGFEKQ